MGGSTRLKFFLVTFFISLVSLPTHATAQIQAKIHVDLPAQRLVDSLTAIGNLGRVNILYEERLVNGLQAPPLKADTTVEQAVNQLLHGTHYKADKVDAHTISIVPAPQASDKGPTADGPNTSATPHPAPEPKTHVGDRQTTTDDGTLKSLAEVVVTAQKREERLIDVPISIVAVSGEEMQQRGVTSILDLPAAVPGLSIFESPSGRSFEIRGISNFGGSLATLVGLYLDDAAVTATAPLDPTGIYDIERIEVLRGPQGTLYGEGSAGGTIRVITRSPDPSHFAMDTYATASFTQDGSPSQLLNTMLNVPLIADELAVRFVGSFGHNGGWIDQPAADRKDINDQSLTSVRVKGLWKPDSQLKVQVMADISRDDRPPGIGEDAHGNFTQVFNLTTAPQETINHDIYNLTLSYDLLGAQLLNTTTYLKSIGDVRDLGIYGQYDPPPLPLDYIYAPHNVITERTVNDELRLTSTGSSPWKWTAGVFFRRDRIEIYNAPSYFGPAGPLADQPPFPEYQGSHLSSAWSFFGDTSYRLTDRFTVGVGVRYYRDHEEYTDVYTPLETGAFHSLDPRVYAQYKATEQINLYASAAKGFRTGGFNPTPPPTFGPESIWTYEFGTKMSLLENRLSVNTAIFLTNYTDYQTAGVPPVAGGVPGIYNAGRARIKGAESDLSWQLTDRWRLTISGTYTNARFTEISVLQTNHIVGDQIDYVPKYQFTASGERDFSWRGKSAFVRLDYSQTGPEVERYRASGSWWYGQSDIIRMLNFKASVDWRSNLRLGVFAQNLLNERGFLNPDNIEGNSARPRPRTYGIEATMTFR